MFRLSIEETAWSIEREQMRIVAAKHQMIRAHQVSRQVQRVRTERHGVVIEPLQISAGLAVLTGYGQFRNSAGGSIVRERSMEFASLTRRNKLAKRGAALRLAIRGSALRCTARDEAEAFGSSFGG